MSKSINAFKDAIKKELDLRAFKNPLFEEKYKNPAKNLDDCLKYIYKTVKVDGRSGFTDDEVFGMAVHYYSESQINLKGASAPNKIIINKAAELSVDEIKLAKEAAKNRVIEEEMDRLKGKNKPKPKKTEKKEATASLFGKDDKVGAGSKKP